MAKVPCCIRVFVLCGTLQILQAARANINATGALSTPSVECRCKTLKDDDDYWNECQEFKDGKADEPRYYRQGDDGKQFCCKLSKADGGLFRMMSAYKTQPNLDFCMEEVRPLDPDFCCVLTSKSRGEIGVRVRQVSVFNGAKDLPENERTWEDYTRKSLPHFRIADITAGNYGTKVMDPSRVRQFVQNFFGTSPPVCQFLKSDKLFAACDLRWLGSPRCCCRREAIMNQKRACIPTNAMQVPGYIGQIPNIRKSSVQQSHAAPQEWVVAQLFPFLRQVIARDPETGTLLLWSLEGEQWRATATEDRIATFTKPFCEMEDQFLFQKAYTGVPIPDTLPSCPAPYISDQQDGRCTCHRNLDDTTNNYLWEDVLKAA
ncbi:unnamed protein product [Symbiodinium sp. KB8]|nr:unnamed protein product [Symbiodinium sp. KB8]